MYIIPTYISLYQYSSILHTFSCWENKEDRIPWFCNHEMYCLPLGGDRIVPKVHNQTNYAQKSSRYIYPVRKNYIHDYPKKLYNCVLHQMKLFALFCWGEGFLIATPTLGTPWYYMFWVSCSIALTSSGSPAMTHRERPEALEGGIDASFLWSDRPIQCWTTLKAI